MGISKLDAVDRKILAELQNDGRMTNVDLAGKVGISAPPCLRRIRPSSSKHFCSCPRSSHHWVPIRANPDLESRPICFPRRSKSCSRSPRPAR